MEDVFTKALATVLKDEGGYANHKADPGGETYRGIARNFWGDWPGWIIIDEHKKKHPPGGKDGIGALNAVLAQDKQLQELIAEFYCYHFWIKIKADKMPSQVGAKVFNMSVNVGTNRAAKLLQIALNKAGRKCKVDGIIGEKTISAVNSVKAGSLIDQICEQQERFYRGIAKLKPSQNVFLKGWLRRAAYRGELW